FEELAVKAARESLTHEAFSYELARAECEERQQRKIQRLLRKSGLPEGKTFGSLRLEPFPPVVRQQLEQLKSGEFVRQGVNAIAVGRPGAGKTQPTEYPHQAHVLAHRHGQGGRSGPSPLRTYPAPDWYHQQAVRGQGLRGVDPARPGAHHSLYSDQPR
ncbi:MAG: ATP-binding protein, partial [Chloroflexota bacterium]|nr:ATP-binding protein [Chloroflexota bacterium]